MEWTKYPFVKFVLYFYAGIFTANTFNLEKAGVITVLIISLTFYLIIHFYNWKEVNKIRFKPVKGFLALSILVCFGILRLYDTSPIHKDNHISNSNFSEYRAIVESPPEKKNSKKKFVVKVSSIYLNQWKPAQGKVLCYIDSAVTINKNDTLIIAGLPAEQERPLNPEEFDYKKFLANKGISHIHFVSTEKVIIRGGNTNIILQLAYDCANWFREIVKEFVPGKAERALALGLILGDKQLLSTEVKEKFSESGLVHILAVSGFHVALIYQVIILITSSLKRVPGSNILIFIISIFLLWLYAVMTGMSPSVIRATSMFSVVLISKLINRKAHGMHNLSLAAFIILLFDPLTAFDVGFQLSVLAVAGILIFNSAIINLLDPDNYILKKAWESISISSSAQIFTFPLVLMMFKDFPVYFLLSNLLATIPVLLIIYLCLLLPVLAPLPFIAKKLGIIIAFGCKALTYSVDLITKLPDPLNVSQPLNFIQVALLFLAVILVINGIHLRKIIVVKTGFAVMATFIVYLSIVKYQLNQQKLFVAFHLNKHSAVAFIKGNQSVIVSDVPLHQNHRLFTFHIEPFLKSKSVNIIKFIENKTGFAFKAENNCIGVNSKTYFTDSWLSAKYLLIARADPFLVKENIINPDRLLILDGSVASYKRKKFKFPAYKTWEQGAFIADLNN